MFRLPLGAINGNMMHSMRTAIWFDGRGGSNFMPANFPGATLTGNRAYKIRVMGVEPFESCVRPNSVFNIKVGRLSCTAACAGWQDWHADGALRDSWEQQYGAA